MMQRVGGIVGLEAYAQLTQSDARLAAFVGAGTRNNSGFGRTAMLVSRRVTIPSPTSTSAGRGVSMVSTARWSDRAA
jgi:hypothetical protein